MRFIRFQLAATCALALAALTASAAAPGDSLPAKGKIKWTKGPATVNIGGHATMEVPLGYVFTDAAGTRAMLEYTGNIPEGSELGFLAPTSMVWFATFDFSEEGYVKDDDKDKLDADKMLKAITKANAAANPERKKRGYPALHVTGWEQKPAYDPETHNLGWAIRAESEGQPIVNFNTRILGRKGIMSVNLVVEPDQLTTTLPEFKGLLTTYNSKSGERYAEYKQGDKLAKYGLTALVVGGAAAAGAKLGLFAWLAVFFKKAWKLVVIAVVAVGAFLKRLVLGRDKTTMDS